MIINCYYLRSEIYVDDTSYGLKKYFFSNENVLFLTTGKSA